MSEYVVADDRPTTGKHRRSSWNSMTSQPLLPEFGGGWRRHFRVFDGKKARHNVPRTWPVMAWTLAIMGTVTAMSAPGGFMS